MIRSFAFCLVICYLSTASSQTFVKVYVDGELWTTFEGDSLELAENLNEELVLWQKKGHVFAGIDSVAEGTIYLHKGRKYLNEDGRSIASSRRKASKQHRELLNSGYPFAR